MTTATTGQADKTVFRSVATPSVTVSTVRVGREYETALIVSGEVLDGVRSATKAAAGVVHDDAVGFVCGWSREAFNRRHAFWARQVAS